MQLLLERHSSDGGLAAAVGGDGEESGTQDGREQRPILKPSGFQ
jgi:hypothetical protein